MKIINWLTLLTVIMVGLVLLFIWNHTGQFLPSLPERGAMTGLQATGFGFAVAFMWVEVLKLGSKKPFNCLKCMCAWFTMFIALFFHVQFWYMYLPVGVAVGAVFSAIKLRWL